MDLIKLSFRSAHVADTNKIITMYKSGFKTLFENYHDVDTNPYMESENVINKKLLQKNSYFFFINYGQKEIGLIRVMIDSEDATHAKISPMLILPEYQNKGFAQAALRLIENKFSDIQEWYIDTIKQEPQLLHLYTKMGYKLTTQPELHIQKGMDLVFLKKSMHKCIL